MSTYHNNPEESSSTKLDQHRPCGYSLFTNCSFEVKTV